jgi:hypothetical protein
MPTLPTRQDITSQMRSTLALSDPELDTNIGTPLRKILDAVAEVIHESQTDTYILHYIYDVDTKTGADLDAFVAVVGFRRLEARRASGSVVFGTPSPATQEYFIPFGTQVLTNDLQPLAFVTNAAAILGIGATEVEVPAQAVLGGDGGNVQASTITAIGNQVLGVSGVTNPVAFTGGADAESDEALRARFKKSVLRNIAGTEQMYVGLALDDPDVFQVNVVGATKRHFEQIELVTQNGVTSVQDSQFVYPDSVIFGPSLVEGNILTPTVHYDFNTLVDPPEIDSLDTVNCPDGIYELEFEYVSDASRNVPTDGITNRIDIYVDGQREIEATETLVWRNTFTFNNIANDPLNRANFRREDGTQPLAGDYFIRYAFSPVMNPVIGNQIVLNGVTYIKDTHFWLVNDISPWGLGPRSRSGIEWSITAGPPPNNSTDEITYTYNEIPTDIEKQLDLWRMVSTDVWVHQADLYYLNFWFAIILKPDFSGVDLDSSVGQVLRDYLRHVGFNGWIQWSDVLAVVHSVDGVDSVRFFNSADHATNFGIARVNPSTGTIITNFNDNGTPKRVIDIAFGDNELPVLNDVIVDLRAQNSIGGM